MENLLHTSSSLYLRQHATNPVHWRPWSDEALKQAAESNKLFIISIGYAACHWCHVMEHESFSDSVVAAQMNADFVCIKVDREERPDLDQQYMAAVQLLTGRGGWPLNCIALPDGRPVYGGTYFRKDDWTVVLERLSYLWHKSPNDLIRQAEELTKGVSSSERLFSDLADHTLDASVVEQIVQPLMGHLDRTNGGTRGAPKFPMPPLIDLLFAFADAGKDADMEQQALLTLRRMAFGGIHDHLGGGFARYAVDEIWRIPHFEKMLYDNAQLLGLYSVAWQRDPEPVFMLAAQGIHRFLNQEFKHSEGGYAGSIDADSEGEEGRYYTWTAAELTELLGEHAPVFMEYYNCKTDGNFEHGRNALYTLQSDLEFFEATGYDPETASELLDVCRSRLLAARNKRTPPATDPKQITAWNAMLASNLITYGIVFDDDAALMDADKLVDAMKQHALQPDGSLLHLFGHEDARIGGFLDDYAQVILALTDLYSLHFRQSDLEVAIALTEKVFDQFHDPASGLFFYSPRNQPVPVARKMELHDHVIPSSNASMALALQRLSFLAQRDDWRVASQRMTGNMKSSWIKVPVSYGLWCVVVLHELFPTWEVTVSGTGAQEAARMISDTLRNQVLVRCDSDPKQHELVIVPCKNQVCHAPVKSVEALTDLIQKSQ
jgi:uncharacterized protein YyaL (SSP411 family)